MSEIRYPEHKKREIFISDRISQGSVKDVIKPAKEMACVSPDKYSLNVFVIKVKMI